MECKKARRTLSDCLDDELGVDLKSELESHLKQCKNCSEFFKDFQKINEIVKLKANEHPSKEYWDSYWMRLKNRLEKVEAGSLSGTKQKVVSLWWRRATYVSLSAMAACLVIMIMQQQTAVPVKLVSDSTIESEKLTQMAVVSEKDIRTETKVFKEMRNVFPDNLKWIQTSNGSMNIGLTSQPGISSDCSMIRIVIFKRQLGQSWHKIWTTEIVTVSEKVVKAPLDGETGGSITLWTHRLPDGLLAIDSDMQLKSPIEVRTSFSGIFEQGKPKQILLFTSGDAEYSIFEVANQLQLEILPQWHKDV